jgi:hypothetical protein
MGWGYTNRTRMVFGRLRPFILAITLLCSLVTFRSFAEATAPVWCVFTPGRTQSRFDLTNIQDLQKLKELAQSNVLTAENEEQADSSPIERRANRGWKQIRRLAGSLLNSEQGGERAQLRSQLLETAAAIENLRRLPLPEKVDFFETPILFAERLSRPVGRGHVPASNLELTQRSDLSLRDPTNSTFWQGPKNISTSDLYHGFGRTNLLLESDPVCTYAGPKEGFGRNPGFEIESGGSKLKLKFAEISSEPFAARIFDAIGFHADPTDYASTVKVRYSRRLFQEFNLRKPLKTHFTFLAIVPLFTLQLQQHCDPFDYMRGAVLKDGTHWSGRELKRRVLMNSDLPGGNLADSNFRPEVECLIAYLETAPASVQQKTGKSIGPWDFGQLDHQSRRELRGAALLAAWLGWFDTRSDNTKLRVIHRDGKQELEHFFSDLGGVLGQTTGILYARGELPNAFPWRFTRPPLKSKPLRLVGYKPVAPTPAFAAMTLDDARWMARLIAELRDEQIEAALVASGFDSAQVSLYLAKLTARRDQMLSDLGLAEELPARRNSQTDQHFSYNPQIEGPIKINVQGRTVEAPIGQSLVARGKLVPAVGTSPLPARKMRPGPPIRFSS